MTTLRSFTHVCACALIAGACFTPLTVLSAGAPRTPGPVQLPHASPLKGFARAIAGEEIEYNSFNPLATRALLTRCTTGAMAIEWETEPVPAGLAGDTVSFVWVASYSTITSSGDRNFDFFINGKKEFTIHTVKGINPKGWRLGAADGSSLAFTFVAEDAARDANGMMTLTVPRALCRQGEPLRLRVVGEKANASDWYMTFMYDMRGQNVEVFPLPFLKGTPGNLRQPVCVAVTYLGEKGMARIAVNGAAEESRPVSRGSNVFQYYVPAVSSETTVPVRVSIDADVETFSPVLKPILPRTVYLLSHAHNDIGYTNIQTEVLKRHVQNIRDAMALIRKTAAYPPEARFKWNIEVNWAVETFMNQASAAERDEFLRDCRDGSICIEALYANVLTGIMRPEDFYRATEYARAFREKYRIPLNTAMISDIPGMTWNMVPALAEAGIRYFSAGPNGMYTGGDRTGHTNAAWSDRPFYWMSPSGNEKILYWMAGYGYASFLTGPRDPDNVKFLRTVAQYFDHLDAIAYPYRMIQMRHTYNGDNGTVDPGLPAYVRKWNETLFSPRLAIATTEELFTKFEKAYGPGLPGFSGDLTPYWEDGAASTAYELGVNRTTAERLLQAEALYALIDPAGYSPAAFSDAWRNVVLFDEHTWGALNSTSDPDSPLVVRQWEIKQAFALDGAREADSLCARIAPSGSDGSAVFDVVNTNSWDRRDLVILSREASAGRDVVREEGGIEVPSQRLASGELAFIARNVPALGARRYTLHAGVSSFASALHVDGETLRDDSFTVRVDKSTGEITSLRTLDPPVEYVDTAGGRGLDGYFYVAGLDAREALRSGPPSIAVGERGPLVASIVVTSDAPGCNSFRREYRLVHGLGRLDVVNTIDKRAVRTNEAVHIGFPFNVPGGTMRVDLGLAVIRPEADQLPGSCKDYYSAQRWADVSNQDFGVTLTVSEAPLVEMGDLHSELPAPRNVDWKTFTPYSSHLASYVMNNYWYTNYKADQAGVSTYHYSIIPHALFNQARIGRTGIERSQPLVVRAVRPGEPKLRVPFMLSPGGIIVTALEPAAHGRALLVRLLNAGGAPGTTSLAFPGGKGAAYMSGLDAARGAPVKEIRLPANGIAIVLVEEESR